MIEFPAKRRSLGRSEFCKKKNNKSCGIIFFFLLKYSEKKESVLKKLLSMQHSRNQLAILPMQYSHNQITINSTIQSRFDLKTNGLFSNKDQ